MHGSRRRRTDQGFTLIELLIVMVIVPVIIGAISYSLIAVFSLKSTVSDRLGASADAQIVSASFYGDVQSATQVTTDAAPSNPSACGASSQILGFQWGTSTSSTEVSYALITNGSTSSAGKLEYNLMRYQCTGGVTTPTTTSVLSYDVPVGLAAQVAGQSCTTTQCSPEPAAGSAGWASATGLEDVNLVVDEAPTNSVTLSSDSSCAATGSTYCYTVAAAPRNWEQVSSSGVPITPPSGVVPAEFLGTGSDDVKSCSSSNPNLDVNGEMVIDSTTSPSASGRANLYPTSVTYVASAGPPSDVAGSPPTNSISSPAADPLAGLPAPDMTGLPTNPAKTTSGGVTYAHPGIYTTALSGTVTLLSGYYELEAGISGNITSGVGGDLLYVTGGTISPSGFQIWPLTSGPYAGLALWQGPAVQPYDNAALDSGGNDTVQIGGILYAPGANFTWHGTASFWVGALLTQGISCSGGGNGEMDIGYYQTISFTAPSSGTVGSHITVSATGGASGNPVKFSIDGMSTSGACTASGTNGSTITFVKAGTCLVDANQANSGQSGGTGGYLEAPTVQQSIHVG